MTPRDAPSDPLEPWGMWVARWFLAMLASVYLALGVHLAFESGRAQDLALLVIWVPAIMLFVAPMTIVASVLRWGLSRLMAASRHATIVPVVGLGALAGPIVLFALFASGDSRILIEPARAGLDVVFALPMVLGGGVASYLADRRVSPRRPRWWLAVVAAALVGVLFLEPVRAVFP